MKRSSLHIAIGLAVTAFLTLGPVSAQARTDGGGAPAVHAPLATSLAAASPDMSPAKSKADDRDRDSRHSEDKDKDRGQSDDKDRGQSDDKDRGQSDDKDRGHSDKDRGDKNRGDRDHNGGDHNGDRCDDTEGLLSGLLCLLLG